MFAPLFHRLFRYAYELVVNSTPLSKPELGIVASVSDPEATVGLYGADSERTPSETASFFTPSGMRRMTAVPFPSFAIESAESSFERRAMSPE